MIFIDHISFLKTGINLIKKTAILSPVSSIHQPLAYGLGCALGIFSCAAVCGGHINPAVTVGHAFLGKLGPTFMANFITSFWIIISQFLGGFVASALVHTLYVDAESSVSKSSVIKFSIKCYLVLLSF